MMPYRPPARLQSASMRTAGHECEAALHEAVSQRGAVPEHLLLVRAELGARRLLQRARQPRDCVVVRAPLHARPQVGMNWLLLKWNRRCATVQSESVMTDPLEVTQGRQHHK